MAQCQTTCKAYRTLAIANVGEAPTAYMLSCAKDGDMPKYRKKPVVIEAVQLLPTTLNPDVVNFIGEEKNYPDCEIAGIDPSDGRFKIKTLEGIMIADVGDFIIRGVSGEFYPCKPDIFEKTYDLVTE